MAVASRSPASRIVALASAACGLAVGIAIGRGGARPVEDEGGAEGAAQHLETAVAERDRELGEARREIAGLRARLEGVESPDAAPPVAADAGEETLARDAANDPEEQRGGARTLESILADLRGRDSRARFMALRDLDELSPEDRARALDAVRATLADEENPGIRFAAVEALAKLSPVEATPLFAQYAADPEAQEYLRTRALDALARSDDPSAAAAIAKAYETGLKGPAARALQKRGDDSLAQAWAEELARDFTSPDSAMRARAIVSTGSLKLPSSYARIAEYADDANSNVRQSVASALGNMGSDALPTLRKLADDPVESVKRAAKFSIRRIEHPEENDFRRGGDRTSGGGAPWGGFGNDGQGGSSGRRR